MYTYISKLSPCVSESSPSAPPPHSLVERLNARNLSDRLGWRARNLSRWCLARMGRSSPHREAAALLPADFTASLHTIYLRSASI